MGIVLRVRNLLALILLLGSAATLSADRVILAPNAKKIPMGLLRIEHLFDQSDHGRFRTALGMGVTEAIDAEFTYEERSEKNFSIDLSYNIVPAVVGISPGISVGVRDALGKTEDGRFYYLAMTQKVGQFGEFNSDTPAEISLGIALGDRNAPLVGVMLPFRESFRVLVDYDATRINAGLEYRPFQDLWIRWIHREGQSLWGLTFVVRL